MREAERRTKFLFYDWGREGHYFKLQDYMFSHRLICFMRAVSYMCICICLYVIVYLYFHTCIYSFFICFCCEENVERQTTFLFCDRRLRVTISRFKTLVLHISGEIKCEPKEKYFNHTSYTAYHDKLYDGMLPKQWSVSTLVLIVKCGLATRSGKRRHQKKAIKKLCDSMMVRFDLPLLLLLLRYKGIEDINPRLNTKELNIDSAAVLQEV